MSVQWRELGLAFTTKAWPVWLVMFGFILSWALAYFSAFLITPNLSTQVRYAGVFLETLGFILVAIGIRGTRKLFDRPSFAANLAQWFKAVISAFKPQHKSVITGTARFNLRAPSVEITGTVRSTTLEGRVEVLERAVESLGKTIREEAQRQKTEVSKLETAIKEEKDQRVSAIAVESRKTEQLAVGGLQYEIVGLVWVLVGTLGSNMPDEIAKIVGHFL